MMRALRVSVCVASCAACSTQAADSADSSAGKAATGARVEATLQSPVSSASAHVGETVRAVVAHDVRDARDSVVIAGGSDVLLTVSRIEPATSAAGAEGHLELTVASVMVRGHATPVVATLDPVPYHLEWRLSNSTTQPVRTAFRDAIATPGTPIAFRLARPLALSAGQ